jgi:hypothetical protein
MAMLRDEFFERNFQVLCSDTSAVRVFVRAKECGNPILREVLLIYILLPSKNTKRT